MNPITVDKDSEKEVKSISNSCIGNRSMLPSSEKSSEKIKKKVLEEFSPEYRGAHAIGLSIAIKKTIQETAKQIEKKIKDRIEELNILEIIKECSQPLPHHRRDNKLKCKRLDFDVSIVESDFTISDSLFHEKLKQNLLKEIKEG